MAFAYIDNLYGIHLQRIMMPFQPVIEGRETLDDIRKNKYRWHYLIPFFSIFFLSIDTLLMWNIYGMDPHYHTYCFHFTIMKFMPEFFMRRSNYVYPAAYVQIMLCHIFAFFDRFKHIDFILLYEESANGMDQSLTLPYRKGHLKFIEPDLAKKLIKFHKIYKKQIRFFVKFLIYELLIAFSFSLIVYECYLIYKSDWEYFPSFRVIFFALTSWFYLRDYVSSIHFSIQFMCQNYVLQIKQRHYLSGMDVGWRLEPNVRSYQQAYNKCQKIMAQIMDFTIELERYNKFYSKYITALIVCFGIVGVAVIDAVIQGAADAPLIAVSPWILYSFIFSIFMILFNAASSRTIFLNIKMFKKLRQLQIRLLVGKCLFRHQIVKLDLVNEYKLLLQKCGFKLLNSSMVNNKLFFFQIFGCVSVFYLKLVSDEGFF